MHYFILTIFPIIIITLIMLQKTNSSVQSNDDLKIPLSPLVKKLQIAIFFSIFLFLIGSLYYSYHFNKTYMESLKPTQTIQPIQIDKNLNKGFSEELNK